MFELCQDHKTASIWRLDACLGLSITQNKQIGELVLSQLAFFFVYWGVYNVMHIQSSLKPMYTPVGEGYCPRTFQTAQDGTTLRFPLPEYPYLSSMNCL